MPPFDSIMNDFSLEPDTNKVFSSSSALPPPPLTKDDEKATPQLNFDGLLLDSADKANTKLPFVWKLFEMLEGVEKSEHDHIVSWVEDGRAFRVHYIDAFLHKVIPQYFNITKYKSFQRQLHFYGFTRINSGPSCGGYFHPQFLKADKARCLSIRPTSSKNKKPKSSKPTLNELKHKDGQWLSEIEKIASRSSIEQPSMNKQQQQEQSLPTPLVSQGNRNMQFAQSPMIQEQQGEQLLQSQLTSQGNQDFQEPQELLEPNPVAFSNPNNSMSLEEEIGPQDGDAVTIFGGKCFHFVE